MTPSRTKSRGGWLLTGLLSLSVVTTLLGPTAAGRMRSAVHWALAPLGDAGMYLTTGVKRLTRPRPSAGATRAEQWREENEALRRKVRYLESEVHRTQRVLQAGRRIFSRWFAPQPSVPVRLVPARVVAADSLPYGWTRIINAGRRRGANLGAYVTQRRILTDRAEPLEEAWPVLSESALVGRIIESGPFTARVQLVTDAGYEVRSQVHRRVDPHAPRLIQAGDQLVRLTAANNEPVEVVAFGDGATGLIVPEVRKVHNLRPGDVLQVRPDVGALPAPVLIGTVTNVIDDPKHAGMAQLSVQPAADLPSLRDVFVVVPELGRLQPRGGR